MPVPAKPDSHSHTVAYGANDIDSLKTLELSCERDEAHLFADIKKIQLAEDDGSKVTAVIYEDVDDFNMGHLTLVEYTTNVDELSLMAIHKAQGEAFLFKGQAYVKNNAVKVLVFREKPIGVAAKGATAKKGAAAKKGATAKKGAGGGATKGAAKKGTKGHS